MVKNITIDNFRGFNHFAYSGFTPITVIGGKNNACKSTLLEAMSLTFGISGGDALTKLNQQRGIRHSTLSDFDVMFSDFDSSRNVHISAEFDNERVVRVDIARKNPKVVVAEAEEGSSISVVDFQQAIQSELRIETRIEELQGSNLKYAETFYTFGQSGSIASTQAETIRPKFGVYQNPNIRANDWEEVLALFKNGESDDLVSSLRILDSRIVSVTPIEKTLYARIEGAKRPIPVSALGDGAVKVAFVLAKIASVSSGGVCAFDEIENGLHYSAMKLLWRAMVAVARKRNVQLIVTTHSLEMLHAISEVAADNDGDDFSYLRLAAKKNGTIVSARYTYPEFITHLKEDFELR